MRDLTLLDEYRNRGARTLELYGWFGDGTCGSFVMPSPIDGKKLLIVASSDSGWEHVSCSHPRRVPNWYELEFVRRKFFKDDETVMQLHVPAGDHINLQSHTLHLWRPTETDIPRPPWWMVGPKNDQA